MTVTAAQLDRSQEISYTEYEATHTGHGRRLAEYLLNSGEYLFTPWAKFDRIWNDAKGVWNEDSLRQIRGIASKLAAFDQDSRMVAEGQGWIDATVNMARALEPRLSAEQEDFDARPTLLAHPDGTTTDLTTGETRASDPADRLTKTTAIAPDRQAVKPAFDALITEMTEGDTQKQAYIQYAWGLSLFGKIYNELCFFYKGVPNAGKSTLVEAFVSAVGNKLSFSMPSRIFTGDFKENQAADLFGRRVILMEEVAPDARLDLEIFKRLVSHAPLSGRQLNTASATLPPSHIFHITCNSLPNLPRADTAVARRARVIRFDHIPAKIDLTLPEKLRVEAPAILQWAIDGAVAGWNNPEGVLAEPVCDAVVKDTDTWLGGKDLLGEFVEAHLLTDPAQKVKRSKLNSTWIDHCTSENVSRPWRISTLVAALIERGVASGQKKTSGLDYVTGVCVLPRDDAGQWSKGAEQMLTAANDPRAASEMTALLTAATVATPDSTPSWAVPAPTTPTPTTPTVPAQSELENEEWF